MARDIKAIKCPHCGSIYKTELKPDFYRCQHCGTEYYLDNNDVHVYHHQQPSAPLQSSSPPGNTKTPLFILIFAILVIGLSYLLVTLFKGNKPANKSNSYTTNQIPRIGSAWYVYTNKETGDPVYLRIYTEYIYRGDDKQDYKTHAQFSNAANSKLLNDVQLFKGEQQYSSYHFNFHTYPGNKIFGISEDTRLFWLNTAGNELTEVTKSQFKTFPQLSSGIAKFEFAYEKDIINIVSNEGNTYYYLPVTGQLLNDAAQADNIVNRQQKNNRFIFDFPEAGFNSIGKQELQEVKDDAGKLISRNFTPGRTYLKPQIVYQDDDHLLVAFQVTAADSSPVNLQAIDVNTGKIIWALPPNSYTLGTTTKCKQGFAVEYRTDSDKDYVHGAIVISATGKVINNFQLKRTE